MNENTKILDTYTTRIFRPTCNPGFQSLHCIASLESDIAPALPYLNAVLGGFEYLRNPPAVTFKVHGKLITIQGREIAINALKDENEAIRILEWLKGEINSAWENRNVIIPSYKGHSKPKVIEILKLLPRTNCRKCGEPTCMVFAVKVAEGVYGSTDCPVIDPSDREILDDYMKPFIRTMLF